MYTDLLPFVNDDKRALLFLRYNYIGEDFSQPINRKETADTIRGEALFQLMLEQNYDNTVKDDNVLSTDFCFGVFYNLGLFHKQIDDHTVTEPLPNKVYKNVYLRWKDLSSIGRKFYSTHMYLTKSENGKDILIRDFNNLSSYNSQTIKLHLRKATNGNTLFCETLPFLPIGTKINTDSDDGKKEYDHQDLIRELYTEIIKKEIEHEPEQHKYKKELNYSSFIVNVIRSSGLNSDLYKYIPSSVETLENLYPEELELSTLNFTRDDNGVLVRDGIKLDDKKLEEDLKMAGICYGTGIKDKDMNCDDVYKCLLDIKPGDISRCKEELENEEMFDVDTNTIRNINPKIMKLILENLGVKITKSFGVFVCESYMSWLDRTEIRKVVLKNKNLGKYISTIIDVVNSNSIILNPKQKSKNLYGLPVFKTPYNLQHKSKLSNKLDNLLLYTKNMSTNPSQSTLRYPANLRFNMSGGAEYSDNATQIKKLFVILFDELDRAGVPLIEKDQERIFATINRMSKLELDLPRLLEDLRVYTDLIKLIGEKEKDDTNLDDFRDIRNNKTQLNDLVNKVNKQIQFNINKQNLIFQVLYNKVQVPLLYNLSNF